MTIKSQSKAAASVKKPKSTKKGINKKKISSSSSSSSNSHKWSQHVTETSHALDTYSGMFTLLSSKKLAKELKRLAETSTTRKSTPYRSAMSMLTFYINRAGSKLSDKDRVRLEEAKVELRKLYNRD